MRALELGREKNISSKFHKIRCLMSSTISYNMSPKAVLRFFPLHSQFSSGSSENFLPHWEVQHTNPIPGSPRRPKTAFPISRKHCYLLLPMNKIIFLQSGNSLPNYRISNNPRCSTSCTRQIPAPPLPRNFTHLWFVSCSAVTAH